MDLGRTPSGWRNGESRHRLTAVFAGTLFIAALFCASVALQRVSPALSPGRSLDSDGVYNLTNIWTIHLTFAPDQWEAMEPKGGGNPFFGGPPGGFPGAGGGGNGDRTLAPALMSQGDLDRDGRISRAEFAKMAAQWFEAWDSNRTGKLDGDQIRAGLGGIRNPAGGGMSGMLLAPEGKRNGISAALLGVEFDYVHADLEFEGHLLRDVGVRYKGNGTFMESRDSLKRSFKIDLNQYAKGQSLGRITTLTLQNNVTDASMMNEVLAYRLYRDAGVPAPRTAYAKVYVTVPGKHQRQYFGLYSMTEAVDKRFAERHFGNKRGAIFKPVSSSLFTDLGADWTAYNQIYDPKTALYDEQKKAVMELSRFVTRADDVTFAARIGEFIDLPEFARFMAVMVYLSDLDGILGPGQNLYLHLHPKNQQFQFIPWDQDHSWGQLIRTSQEQRDNLSIHRPWQEDNFFLERMFKVEAFKKLYLARMQEFGRTLFEPDRIARQVDEMAAVIRPAVREESESRLARFDRLVAGEVFSAPGPFGGGQTKPIKPFSKARTASILNQLAGRSEGLAGGGGFPGGFGGMTGLGMFSRSLVQVLDVDRDAAVTRAEFSEGFARLFQAWNTDRSGALTLAQLRSGIAKELPPSVQGFPFGGPPGPGGGRRGPDGPGGGGSPPAIAGTRDPGLFASERWGMTAFSLKAPNGKYLAKLYFAETYAGITGPGQRVFSLNVQGRELKDFDIWAKAGGRNRAYVESVPVEVTNGEFRIVFTRQVENPAINGIELLPQADAETATASAIRVKAGSSAPFTDSAGQVWQPDTGFEGGSTSQVSGGFGPGASGPGGRPPFGLGPPPGAGQGPGMRAPN